MRKLLFTTAFLFLPWMCLAQNGFRVSQETGLEPVAQRPGDAKPANNASASATPAKSGTTEITDTVETTFDETGRVAIFTGDVKVVNPQFTLTCQKLTAYLKKAAIEPGAPAVGEKNIAGGEAETSGTGEGKNKPKSGTASTGPAGGLDHAVAEGDVIIVQDKVDPATGEVTHCVGKGTKATYNTVNGEMMLFGWPQIQQGINTHIATSESTVMVMNQDGHLKTVGPSKSLIQEPAKTKAGASKEANKSEPTIP